MNPEQVWNPHISHYSIIFRQGIVGRRQKMAIWEVGKEGRRKVIFVNCPFCGKINKLATRRIRGDGFFYGAGCFYCINEVCSAVLIPYLSGWPGSIRKVEVI